MRPSGGGDLVLEEKLQSFNVGTAAPSRLRRLAERSTGELTWGPPTGTFISDFCRHPSGELSAVLVGEDKTISIARLTPELTQLSLATLHDPDVATDPHAAGTGVTDLEPSNYAPDAARVAAVGDATLVAVMSSLNALIAYRLTFDGAAWSAPSRTLVEPPTGITFNIPIGGSFDTFGAVNAWFRCPLDVDEAGNAYVTVWGGQKRLRSHQEVFQDGLSPLPGDPAAPSVTHADLLLTKISAGGARLWTRLVGTEHEDEPYAIRAHGGLVAIVGRSRRAPGFDNTIWDALLSVSTTDGELVGTRTFPLNASGVLLAVDALPGGGWLLGGSDGWSQNPEGLSVFTFGQKLLLGVDSWDAEPERYALAPGPRHNELRTVLRDSHGLWFGGHEDGPTMHTGDGDASQIHATGVLGFLPQ